MDISRSPELRAGAYDRHFNLGLMWKAQVKKGVVEEKLRSFLALLPSRARVLDIAAGVGCESLLIERCGKLAYPLDISRKMLMLQAVVAESDPRDRGFLSRRVQGDIFKLPFPDGVFNAACFFHILELGTTSEREAMLVEARRVLVPGGRLFIATEWIPRNILKIGEQGFVGKEEELIAESQRFLGLTRVYFEQVRMKPVYLEILLRKSGFSDILTERCNMDTSRWTDSRLIFAKAQK